MTYFKPHSPEWFHALAQVAPEQAQMTRKIIADAGSTDVCTVCGDAQSAAYKLVGEKIGAIDATMRFCIDCKGIRGAMHGEKFEPL